MEFKSAQEVGPRHNTGTIISIKLSLQANEGSAEDISASLGGVEGISDYDPTSWDADNQGDYNLRFAIDFNPENNPEDFIRQVYDQIAATLAEYTQQKGTHLDISRDVPTNTSRNRRLDGPRA